MQSGHLFLILGPSGSGKGTVISHLKKTFPEAVFPLSCTTRDPRPGEKSGDAYYFISKDEFKDRIEKGDFLEWAIVHNDNYYGTLKEPILKALQEGKTVIREVDMQGVRSIRTLLGTDHVSSLFITAPSWENLKGRILGRSKLPDEEVARRKASFEKEMAFAKECDFMVMSLDGKIAEQCGEVEKIIRNY